MHTVDKIFLPSAAAAWHKNWNGTTFKLCKTTPEEFITTNMLKPTVEKVQLLSRFGDCFAQLSEVTPAVSVVTNEKGACIKTQVCVYGSDIALHWNFKFLAFLQVWVWGKQGWCLLFRWHHSRADTTCAEHDTPTHFWSKQLDRVCWFICNRGVFLSSDITLYVLSMTPRDTCLIISHLIEWHFSNTCWSNQFELPF